MTKGRNPVGHILVKAPLDFKIPKSHASFEPILNSLGQYSEARIHCGGCHRRLFDLRIAERDVSPDWDYVPRYETRIVFTRACPTCSTIWLHDLTVERGIPVGNDGPVRCPRCLERGRGGFLASIDAARGRIILPCPKSCCKTDVRVDAPYVYQQLQTLNFRLRQPREKERVNWDDVPF